MSRVWVFMHKITDEKRNSGTHCKRRDQLQLVNLHIMTEKTVERIT